MTQQTTDATPQNEAEGILQESVFLIDMPENERTDRLKELDLEISMIERAHLGSDDNPDLPSLSESEQRNLNWMLSWESFDRMIEKNAEQIALQFQTENNALANLALEKLYRSFNDQDTANDYLAKAKLIVKGYTAELINSNSDWKELNPFQDDSLKAIFKEQCAALTSERA